MGRRPAWGDAGEFRPTRRATLTGVIACVATARPAFARFGAEPNPKATSTAQLPSPSSPPQPWTELPPTPNLPPEAKQETLDINGTQIFYARLGRGSPVIFLHGGMGNSNYWGRQITHLAQRFDVIAMDTRGHGRSPLMSSALGYGLFAQDVVALMDALSIPKAAIVGWSDGAITGLQLAMRYPDRVERLFAFAGNLSHTAMKRCAGDCPTFVAYARRCKAEYAAMSPDPDKWRDLLKNLRAMWRAQQAYDKTELASIRAPTVIADGQYDEIIKPNHVTEAARMIRGAQPLSLARTSHFAMLQDPVGFNAALDLFLAPLT